MTHHAPKRVLKFVQYPSCNKTYKIVLLFLIYLKAHINNIPVKFLCCETYIYTMFILIGAEPVSHWIKTENVNVVSESQNVAF